MNKFDWLSQLISFDTTSRNSNLELIQCVQDWLSRYKLKSKLIQDKQQPKANLFATLPAHDGTVTGGLILSGHTDVVPVDGQAWETNPFQAQEINGKIYGRGACDMKGFIAVVLGLIPEFQQMQLAYPIHIALSYDEEIGCLGAPLMIDDIVRAGLKPAACIVGEPTNMMPVVAHKGKQSFRCRVHGVAAHSSLTTQGCNAIEYAARLICFIRDMADHYRLQGVRDDHYDVPFTTLTTNLINGGNAYNTIPAICEFIFEFRNLPQDRPNVLRDQISHYIEHELVPMMKQDHPDAGIELDTIAAAPGLDISENEVITRLVRSVTQVRDIYKVAYATEAGMFQEAAIPTIICGPGSIEQAHRANEYVEIEQIERCESFLRNIVGEMR